MKTIKNLSIILLAVLCMYSCKAQQNVMKKGASSEALVTTNSLQTLLPGASVMTFGPNNVLFVGDSKAGVIYAIETQAKVLKDPISFNLKGVDRIIAKKLGVSTSDLIFNDMQIHPVSQEAYIAVQRGFAPDAPAVIVAVSPADSNVRLIDLSKKTQVQVKNIRTDAFEIYKRPSSRLNITDIDYHDGYIYVAGLTNGEFASTLRKIAYPFSNKQETVSGIEMYHAVHLQKETRAPIRTMAFEEINGESTLIAAYTCTPLVSIPTSEIKEGNHVKAKTIAELGYGNTPIDMITFTAQEQDGSFDKKLLIINKERSASLISLKDFAEANKGKGLEGFSMGPEGVKIFPVPMSGTMQVAEQNQMMLTTLQRNIDSGSVDLLSELKGAYFRLSNFDSEYEFPDYKYTEGGKVWKDFHNMVKPMEGFPELIKEK
ncbi:hypothetical protein [uncultured Kordia sp.]|uniref:hypothetical protein n=1 Tax=uncultured Kordia sp. TaxID=507699 RepID=UPI00261C80B6|nr:hypothetical protein [uncultured Kordia sp.]